jgi:hypothetical protein
VPGAAQKVDPLARRGQEGARRARAAPRIGRHDHEEGVACERQEGLAALGMALDHVEPVGQAARPGVEDRQPCAAIAEVESRAVVEAAADPVVDQPVGRAHGLEHVAEGGEGGGRQRLGGDPPHGRSALSRCQRDALDLRAGLGEFGRAVVSEAAVEGREDRVLACGRARR